MFLFVSETISPALLYTKNVHTFTVHSVCKINIDLLMFPEILTLTDEYFDIWKITVFYWFCLIVTVKEIEMLGTLCNLFQYCLHFEL